MTVTSLPLSAPPAAPTAVFPTPTYQPAPVGPVEGTPNVFAAIAAVMRDVMPVAKDKENQQQRYKFRGVDDAMSAMAGPMRAHGLFILPSIADHRAERRGDKMTHVNITMRYHVYGPAGDCLTAEVPGEANDFADKATNKAQSAALKYLLFTLFMIPVDGRSIDDGDRDTPIEPTPEHHAERQQRQQQRGQQPRRSNRAEPGPWEQPQQQPKHRDYLTEAERADNPHQFAKIRAAAAENGAPAEFLARLDAIDARKRQAAQQRQQARPHDDGHRHANDAHRTAPDPADTPRMERAKDPAEGAAEAENALRLAASRANLPTLDADFQTVYGIPLEQATAQQLNTFRAKIEAAGGAQ